jgi:hypothetical protein
MTTKSQRTQPAGSAGTDALSPVALPYGSGLFDHHADLLRESCISHEVARERGYRSADTKAHLERCGFAPSQRLTPALVIPLHGPTGEVWGYQSRPDEPRWIDGRLAKYETPRGLRIGLDVHPSMRHHLGDPSVPIIVTEGVRKADAAVGVFGVPAIALLGVWNFRGKNDAGGLTALADWEYVALNDGRQVLIVFDSDVMFKEQVHAALARLGAFLAQRGADVRYAYLPHGPAGAKVGLDDWLAQGHALPDLHQIATDELRRADRKTATPTADTFDDIPEEDGPELFDAIAAELDRYLVWTPAQRDAVVMWIAHTHTLGAFDHSPRLAVKSPSKGCGKSRLLELVEQLAREARLVTSISSAYMFRSIEDTQPCLLIDEVDAIFGSHKKNDGHEDLRSLINSGFRKGAVVGRMVGDGAGMMPRDFAVFTPVALAGIGDCLPDTVVDRAVVIEMHRPAPGEDARPLRRREALVRFDPLRRRLKAWAARNLDDLADANPEMPIGITDRTADIWEPLLGIADQAGADWPDRVRRACTELNVARADAALSVGPLLLSDLKVVFADEGTERMFSAAIVEKLNGLEEAPWSGWHRGQGFRVADLAKNLRGFGIRSKNVRVGAEQRKGYEIADLDDAFGRYLPDPLRGSWVHSSLLPSQPSQAPSRPENTPSDQDGDGWDGGTAFPEGVGVGRQRVQSHEREEILW